MKQIGYTGICCPNPVGFVCCKFIQIPGHTIEIGLTFINVCHVTATGRTSLTSQSKTGIYFIE